MTPILQKKKLNGLPPCMPSTPPNTHTYSDQMATPARRAELIAQIAVLQAELDAPPPDHNTGTGRVFCCDEARRYWATTKWQDGWREGLKCSGCAWRDEKAACHGSMAWEECPRCNWQESEDEDACECCGEKSLPDICPGYQMCLACFKEGVAAGVYGECCADFCGAPGLHVCCA